ncbi:MAG: Endoribonuclease [Candidatus Tokpelaia sp. JSC161]|jgi:enamine deaminase RidA (YjgF/YER057c/UK114 family)|nr:MAG: Endoribonuclease [Candidatus Tokpelaia sp. JSC161]
MDYTDDTDYYLIPKRKNMSAQSLFESLFGSSIAPPPISNYIPLIQRGNQIFISGQLPFKNGNLIATGKAGKHVNTIKAQEAAESCALNILAQAHAQIKDLNRIQKVIKINVFIAAIPDFTNLTHIANAASNIFIKILGKSGTHARSTLGVSVLPMNATVEVDAILEI